MKVIKYDFPNYRSYQKACEMQIKSANQSFKSSLATRTETSSLGSGRGFTNFYSRKGCGHGSDDSMSVEGYSSLQGGF